ncbi:hypothetical protein EV217_2659 [Phyllobacterium myrsinacearum]|jgi:hypothetical protein|nr:hypothetical protein BJ928_101445 [Rhizobium sp. WW_1]RZS83908.1 hypothetical protein EV217_2659 [Phyllobacterium myrsinacearum]
MRPPWKMIVRTLKQKPPPVARPAVAAAILEAGGVPLKLRLARRSLYLLSVTAENGSPVVIETEGGFVCLISLDDLAEVIVEPSPSLKEVMEGAGVTRRARRKMSERRGTRPP